MRWILLFPVLLVGACHRNTGPTSPPVGWFTPVRGPDSTRWLWVADYHVDRDGIVLTGRGFLGKLSGPGNWTFFVDLDSSFYPLRIRDLAGVYAVMGDHGFLEPPCEVLFFDRTGTLIRTITLPPDTSPHCNVLDALALDHALFVTGFVGDLYGLREAFLARFDGNPSAGYTFTWMRRFHRGVNPWQAGILLDTVGGRIRIVGGTGRGSYGGDSLWLIQTDLQGNVQNDSVYDLDPPYFQHSVRASKNRVLRLEDTGKLIWLSPSGEVLHLMEGPFSAFHGWDNRGLVSRWEDSTFVVEFLDLSRVRITGTLKKIQADPYWGLDLRTGPSGYAILFIDNVLTFHLLFVPWGGTWPELPPAETMDRRPVLKRPVPFDPLGRRVG